MSEINDENERLLDIIELLQAKVERLTKRGLQDLNWQNDELHEENERLRGENKRLRGLLKECQLCMSLKVLDLTLLAKIVKEVSDE